MKNKKTFILIAVLAIISFTGIYAIIPASAFEPTFNTDQVSYSDSTDTKTYTCPMHPDVISDKPGECPKCGMDLEVKDPKKDDDKDEKKDEKKDQGHNHKEHKCCMKKH